MRSLAYDVDQRSVDKATASRLERPVRDALDLVNPSSPAKLGPSARQEWLQRLDDALHESAGTAKRGASIWEILDNVRSDRC